MVGNKASPMTAGKKTGNTKKTLTKMSWSRASAGTVVQRSWKASSLNSSMDTEKFPSSVLRVMLLQTGSHTTAHFSLTQKPLPLSRLQVTAPGLGLSPGPASKPGLRRYQLFGTV